MGLASRVEVRLLTEYFSNISVFFLSKVIYYLFKNKHVLLKVEDFYN